MIKGIGVDIVDLRRIAKNKDALANKILSDKEIEVYRRLKNDKRKIEFLGGRFAGKEAYFKAVSNMVAFKDITILNDTSGNPYINYSNVHISIAHENDYAIAYIIYEEG